MTSFSTLGVCKVQLDPVCSNGDPDPTRTSHVVCNVINIDKNSRSTDALIIQEPSGIPGQNCVDLEIDGTDRPPEIVWSTCGAFDPVFDGIASGRTEAIFDANGDFVGMQARAKEGDNCLCACAEEGETACNRWDATVWQKAICPGSSGAAPAGGRFAVERYPNLEFRIQDSTVSLTNSGVESGRRTYLATAYEPTGDGYAGPADITPVELEFDRCVIGPFLTNVCPPGSCGCGGCDQEAETPLSRAGAARSAGSNTSSNSSIPDASELLAA